MSAEKPSCIKELKILANSLTVKEHDAVDCILKVKNIVNNDEISPAVKILKLKQLCKEYGK